MREARTVLAQLVRERHQTLEEFAEYAEQYAREHGEPGSLGVRHLQRLAAGKGPNGRPLGPVRPATARLLEAIFDMNIDQLLAHPANNAASDEESELRRMLHTSRRVDRATIMLLRNHLTEARQLDRRYGAIVAYDEVRSKAQQVANLSAHCVTGGTRPTLSALASEFSTLAGWQALDLGKADAAWRHYELAKSAAREAGSTPCLTYAHAEQAFILLDIGDTPTAVDVLSNACAEARQACSPRLRAWLTAAHGEALAATGDRDRSLHAFDTAHSLLSDTEPSTEDPYVALDNTHLVRWRGHALARFGDTEAVTVLRDALDRHDRTFTRAETALRIDLATAFAATHDRDSAEAEAARARELANDIGSTRQQRRINRLTTAPHY